MIKKIGVLGAGQMGNGIAHVFARHGFKVLLCDVDQQFLSRGIETIRKNLSREVAKRKLFHEEMEAALGLIHGTLNRAALAGEQFAAMDGDCGVSISLEARGSRLVALGTSELRSMACLDEF